MFEFKFSTVWDYYSSVRKEISEKNLTLQIFHDDFFPLEQIYEDSFWTGYYTSRPNSKREMRDFAKYTHASNLIYAMDRFKLKEYKSIIKKEL